MILRRYKSHENLKLIGLPTKVGTLWKYVVLSFVCVALYYVIYHFLPNNGSETDRVPIYSKHESPFLQGCRLINIHPFDPSIRRFFEKLPNQLTSCYNEPYIRVQMDKLQLNWNKVKKEFGDTPVRCIYRSIERPPSVVDGKDPDYEIPFSKSKPLVFGKSLEEEFLQVECFQKEQSIFKEYVALTFLKPEVEKRCDYATKEYLAEDPLSVILIVIDSVSRLNFLRHFTKTNHYLQTVIKPYDFHGYVKVAEDTFDNLVPILTGHFVEDYGGEFAFYKKFADIMPLIWKNLSALGYRTLYTEDSPRAGAFTYFKRGFNHQPTDYYPRPFTLAVEKAMWGKENGRYCFGHEPDVDFHYNYTINFIRTMKDRPYFSLTFLARETDKDLNQAGFLDESTFQLMRELYDSGILEKSALFFFSDHGIRFGEILETYVGKIEQRMPFMFQSYPNWFLKKHQDFARNLELNQGRLTTSFDVHKTLKDIARLSSKNQKENYTLDLGQSLFKEIPLQRTCKMAHIKPNLCPCHEFFEIPSGDTAVPQLAQLMLDTINDWLNVTHISDLSCSKLTVKKVINAYLSVPRLMMLSKDIEKFEASKYMSEASNGDGTYYLITVSATPGEGVFEGTMRRSGYKVSLIGGINRINQYKDEQAWCLKNNNPHLKQYCYCRKPAPKNDQTLKVVPGDWRQMDY